MEAAVNRRTEPMDMGIYKSMGLYKGRGARKMPFDLYMLAIGLFLLLSPWLYTFAQEPARVNDWATGAALVIASVAALAVFGRWQEWLMAALGLWLVSAPWVLGYAHTSAMHVSIIAGIVVMYLALLELWLIHDGRFDGGYAPDVSSS
jgi:hypothetical protein